MESKEIVFNAIAGSKEPLKSADIANKTGLDKKEVDKSIKKLKDENKIFSPKMCYYTIKQ